MTGYLKRNQIFESNLLDDDGDDDNSDSSDESSSDEGEFDAEEDLEDDAKNKTQNIANKENSQNFASSSSSSATEEEDEEESHSSKDKYFANSRGMTRSETVEMLSSDTMPPPHPPPPPLPIQIDYVFGRSKKNPFKWQTVPNFDSNKSFYESFGPSLNEPYEHLKTVDEFFSAIFTNQLLEKIVEYTNIGLKLKYGEKIPEPVSLNELKAFIGLLITFGITKKRRISVEKIWKTHSVHWCPAATGAMSRDRFQLIFKFKNICFDDKRTRNERKNYNRKFYKMEECYLMFKNNLKSILNPSSKLCIDECLYACKCRCAFIQFM
jgi:hypothetical protein